MRFRVCFAFLALIVLIAAALSFVGAAGAATHCRQQVIQDWSDNGRIDRAYQLECYEQAMRSMPPEIRDYTDAPEVIDRALTLAVRKQGGVRQNALPAVGTAVPASTTSTADTTAIPTSLFVLGAIMLSGLALGAFGYIGHRATSGRRGASR